MGEDGLAFLGGLAFEDMAGGWGERDARCRAPRCWRGLVCFMVSLLSGAGRAARNLRGGVRSAHSRAAHGTGLVMFARSSVSPARARLLEERARGMRLSPTRSEEWLWQRLAGSKAGWAFRRQLVIGEHIVDFACTKVRLVVEVEGGSHVGRERHDAARDRRSRPWGGGCCASPSTRSSAISMRWSRASLALRSTKHVSGGRELPRGWRARPRAHRARLARRAFTLDV